MTDLERFVEFQKTLGVACVVYEWGTEKLITFSPGKNDRRDDPNTNTTDKVEGDSWLDFDVVFDGDGKFVTYRIYD